ncbi:MAG: hypothetical protein JST22_10900 [Bacteroidetes bacterium]|nr:hypothetical protein [Bacteroidota bacterium]
MAAYSQASAGGWVQDLGKVYAKLSYNASSANTVYKFDGALKYPTDNPPFTVRDYPIVDRELSLYIEYGLTKDLTLIGSTTMKRVIITSPAERKQVQGLGDVGLSARYLLASFTQQVVSATLGLAIPTGYTRDLTPPLGSGNLNIELAGNYGISFYPAPAYATASLGFRLRPSIFLSKKQDPQGTFDPNYSNEVFSDMEAGYTLFDRVLLHGVARFLFSTRTDNNDFDVEHPPETQRYIKLGGGVIVDVYKGIQVNVDALATPYGVKASNSIDLSFGVAYAGKLF